MKGAGPQVAIIGAGIVGLACGAELARSGRTVVVLERHPRPAQECSSRNSQVLHAGIYYPAGSLKALACVEGRDLLYERCQKLGIPHRRLGKLIVAADPAELEALDQIRVRAVANGAGGIVALDARAVREREPRVRALAGVWSPNSGIVDAHALADSFQAELEAAGGEVVFRTQVLGLEPGAAGWQVHTRGPDAERFSLAVEHVVNAAGLESDRVAALAGVDVDACGWRLRPCKGDYFAAAPRLGALTRHLVYPVPPAGGGLGIHVTVDLGGRYRLGPDAEYVDRPTYEVDPAKAERFAASAARWLPELRPEDLSPDMAGVRPKLQGPGESFRDFVVADGAALGAPGTIHLVGIESPGLTAAPALARRVARLLG